MTGSTGVYPKIHIQCSIKIWFPIEDLNTRLFLYTPVDTAMNIIEILIKKGNKFMKTAFFTFLFLTTVMMPASANEQEYVIPTFTTKHSLESLSAENKKHIDDILQQLANPDERSLEFNKEEREKQEKARKIQEQLSRKPNVRIGMTTDQVLNKTNWGRPKDINTTINAHGKFEQWVYGLSQYLYFTNGKLASIQY